MGTIRTLLALSVVFTHSYGFLLVGGRLAVQLFYMISGFLISYILVERRSYPTWGGFYLNRALRLLPVYLVLAALTLLAHMLRLSGKSGIDFFETWAALGSGGRTMLAASNVLILGQDVVMFTGASGGELYLTSNFRLSTVQVWHGLLVPQAWTLGVELSFYLLAPFVLTKPRSILWLLAGSVLVRAYLVYLGLGTQDPWMYRFFPAELALFLVGSLAHQRLKPLYDMHIREMDRVSTIVTVAFASLICVFFALPFQKVLQLAVVGAFAVALPFTFHFQSRHVWDRRLGELSYPIYISHMLVIGLVSGVTMPPGLNQPLVRVALIVVCTLALSYLLHRFVADPVERLRHRVRST